MCEETQVDDFFRLEKINKAIGRVFDVLGDEELSVVESFWVAKSVNSALKGKYPGAYELFERLRAENK